MTEPRNEQPPQPGEEVLDEWATAPPTPTGRPSAEPSAPVALTPADAAGAVTDIVADVAGVSTDVVNAAVLAAVSRRVDAIVERPVAADFDNSDLAERLEKQAQDLADVTIADHLTAPGTAPGRAADHADGRPAETHEREPQPVTADDGDSQPELFFGSVDQFVRGFLCHVYRRNIDARSERVWAPDWWRYPEAVSRLESLWRAWEALRLDPAIGMSVWWRDHADHHMIVRFSPGGPFAGAPGLADVVCRPPDPLPCAEPPAALFPDVRTSSL